MTIFSGVNWTFLHKEYKIGKSNTMKMFYLLLLLSCSVFYSQTGWNEEIVLPLLKKKKSYLIFLKMKMVPKTKH